MLAELSAMALLILKGYRILGWRCRTNSGEIDIVAGRGRSIAFVEVKHRRSKAEFHDAISDRQLRRIERGADDWIVRKNLGSRRDYTVNVDAIFVSRWGWPTHHKNFLQAYAA